MKHNFATIVYSHYSRDARVRRYCESLARKGFQVDVFCLYEDYIPIESNITLFKYPLPRKRFGRLWYILEYLLFFTFSIITLTYKFFFKKYKIVHINNMPDILIFTAIIPKLFGTKIILDMHDPMPELYMSKYHVSLDSIMVKWLKWLEGISLTFADYVLTANDSFKALFLKRNKISKDKISVILNCPDPRIFIRKQKTNNRKKFILFYMGTVDERFGLDIVIEALPQLINKIPNIVFQIIPKLEDEGKYLNSLKCKVQSAKLDKYFHILNPLPLEKIAEKMQEADIGIVLAKNGVFTENIFPVKLLEFVQMEIPVIATKTKVLSQYFSDSQIYFLKKNNPVEFSKAVLNLYRNNKLRNSLSLKSKQYLKKYNWIKEEKIYYQKMESLIN